MVSGKLRNADKQAKKNLSKGRRHLSSLSVKSNDTRETLFTLPIGENGRQQKPKTVEIVNGKPQFYIVIPCSTEEPKGPIPLYLVKENENGGAESGVWQCQECTAIFHARRSWEKHKGIRWITGPKIKVCS